MRKARQKRIRRETKTRTKKIIRLVIVMIPIAVFLDVFYHFSNNFGATLFIGILILFIIVMSQLGGNIGKKDIDSSHYTGGYGG